MVRVPVVEEVSYVVFERLKGRVLEWRSEQGTLGAGYAPLPGEGITAWGVRAEERLGWLVEVEREVGNEYERF